MGLTGRLTKEEITSFKCLSNGKNPSVFCETGTYKAHSTLEASYQFEKVYTIEISKKLYDNVKDNNPNNNIDYILGDTIVCLPLVVDVINNSNEGCMWFLDAHQSGPDTENNGNYHCPLIEELEIILNNRMNTNNDIFIFDDVRLYTNYNDWKHISTDSIKNVFERHNKTISNSFIVNDRFIVYT